MDQIELIEKRKPREKHFLQKDGTIRAEVYGEDVHYLKDGKYEEIDNTLIEEKECFTNKSNSYRVEFDKDFKDSLMRISKNKYFINFKLYGVDERDSKNEHRQLSEKINNKISTEITRSISLEHEVFNNKVKETIIINNMDYNNIIFEIDTNLELSDNSNSIFALDKDKQLIFKFETPFMIDALGKECNNVSYKIRNVNNKKLLELVLDKDWMMSDERKFPIYIDPTITNESQNTGIYDTYIYPGDTNVVRYDKAYLKAGVEKNNNNSIINRTLIKFDLPTLTTGDEIIFAGLNLISYPTYTSNPKEYIATVHRITTDWNESTADWSSMNDKYDSHVETMFKGKRSPIINNTVHAEGNYCDGNITNIVKEWYKETPNYGLMIKSYNEEYVDDDYPVFCSNEYVNSSLKPTLIIEYRNQNGIENYLNYKKQQFTDCCGYVNTYNGNYTNIFNVGYTTGGNMPILLSLIYNTNDVILQKNSLFGTGFRLNYEQKVTELCINNETCLKYEDDDCSIHYLFENNGNYTDEDGLGITGTLVDNKYILKDLNGNIREFSKLDINDEIYYLTKIKDVDNNCLIINYNLDKTLSSITDNNNTVSITYGQNCITINGQNSVTYINTSNNRISSIITKNGETLFEYNSNNLINQISDPTGIKISYDYYSSTPYQIKKVTKKSILDNQGEYYLFDYKHNTTLIKDNLNRCNTLIFNDNGSLLSMNSLTSEEEIDNAYSICNERDAKNKIVSSTIPFKNIKNYLFNTSFEDSNIYFIPTNDLILSISNDYSNYGDSSLKCVSSQQNQSLTYEVNVPKGTYYTFSFYSKSTVDYKAKLSYYDANNEIHDEIINCNMSSDFERNDLTINYPTDSLGNLIITILLENIGTLYLDDIQLENGKVANSYNVIENSNFSQGYSDWNVNVISFDESLINTSDYISTIIFNNGKSSALKVKGHPLKTFIIEKTLNIKGNSGDLFTFSFWFKNNGIPGLGPVYGSNVAIYFKPVGHEAEYCIPISDNLNANKDTWQYFTYRSHAREDYEYIRLSITIGREINDFYITNLSFNKEVTCGDYSYDERGNLISLTDQSNNSDLFEYNENDKMASSVNSLGKKTIYEYDLINKERLINVIESNGISNKYYYNNNGNLVKIKTSKNYDNILSDGVYKLRYAGTNKYLKAELNFVLLEENECSNTLWNIKKIDNKYKIMYANNNDYCLCYSNGNVILSTSSTENLFELEKNESGTYCIRYIEDINSGESVVKYLLINGNLIEFRALSSPEDIKAEFYIELNNSVFIEKTAKYTTDGKYVSEITDTLMKKHSYERNNDGLVTKMTNPKNIDTLYSYNNKGQCISINQEGYQINYGYNSNNLLSAISSGDKTYELDYDEFLNMVALSINNYTLISNEYGQNNGNLIKKIYGNGNIINYSYDLFDRVVELQKNDDTYCYFYDNNGNISKITSEKYTKKYNYDKANRLYRFKNDEFESKYLYDSENNIIEKKYIIDSQYNIINNTYDTEKIISTCFDNDITILYTYDELNRNTGKSINNILNENINYYCLGNRTSGIIKKFNINNDSYEYKYDDLYNITDIYFNNNIKKHYMYDSINQLTDEIDYTSNTIISYLYDYSGNIVQKITKDLNTNNVLDSKIYQYSNINWEDQLTSYDGQSISYDNMGNMKTFGTKTFNWINGCELASYIDSATSLNNQYEYDANGIRRKKISNNNETIYYNIGTKLIYEINNNYTIYYLYDVDNIIGFKYNNNNYYYLKNGQNDVIGILDSNGNRIVSYNYDSWGKVISIKDNNNNPISQTDYTNIANINPIRYRCYYYDTDTGLYYLNYRYYNPEIGRFISPDLILGSNNDILSLNLYAYVGNNPVNNVDLDGMKSKKSVKKFLNSIKKKIVSAVKLKVAQVTLALTLVKNTISSLINYNNNGIKFVAEIGGGEGIGVTGTQVGLTGYNDLTIGIKGGEGYSTIVHNEEISYNGIGIGETITHDYNYSMDTDNHAAAHDHYSKLDPNEFKFCPNAVKDGHLMLGPVTIDDYGDVSAFYGLDVSIHVFIGFHVKIGFEDEVAVEVQ